MHYYNELLLESAATIATFNDVEGSNHRHIYRDNMSTPSIPLPRFITLSTKTAIVVQSRIKFLSYILQMFLEGEGMERFIRHFIFAMPLPIKVTCS